jgi:hypothetical protein
MQQGMRRNLGSDLGRKLSGEMLMVFVGATKQLIHIRAPVFREIARCGRFLSPWHADKMPGCYVVRDANGGGALLPL